MGVGWGGDDNPPEKGRAKMASPILTKPAVVPTSDGSLSTDTAPVQRPFGDLTGRTAIVTGAGSGIGAAIAAELAQGGAYVLVQDLRPEPAAAVAKTIQATGGAAEAIAGDVSKPDDVRSIVDSLLESHDRIDILVNNAGVQHVAPLESFPLVEWN